LTRRDTKHINIDPYKNLVEQDLFSFLKENPKENVKTVIEKMCVKDNKYTRKYDKEDFLAANDFIFNLNKTHKLKIDRNCEIVVKEDSFMLL
jgi:hypothetical protein